MLNIERKMGTYKKQFRSSWMPYQPIINYGGTLFHIKMTAEQLNHLGMLCKFHLADSINEGAKRMSKALLARIEESVTPKHQKENGL